jgi:hypothetical protein
MNDKLQKIIDGFTTSEDYVQRIVERFSNEKRWEYIPVNGHRSNDDGMDDYFEHVNQIFKDKIDFVSIDINNNEITFKQNKLELRQNENLIFKLNGKSIKKEHLMDALKNIVLVDGVNMKTIKGLTGQKIKKSDNLTMSVDEAFLLLASDEFQSNILSSKEPLIKPYISTTKTSNENMQEYLMESGLLKPLFLEENNKTKSTFSLPTKKETKITKQKI